MIALVHFQVSGYVRSLRVLHPLIVVLLFMALVLLQGPSGDDARTLAAGTFGDVAAFAFPVWAWTARALLDTQPDEQRALSATAARYRPAFVLAGPLAAYAVNLCLAGLVLVAPVAQALAAGVGGTAVVTGVALNALVAAAATVLGVWTSRAIIPDPGLSVLMLLGGVTAALLLSLSPLSWAAVPMVEWLRAAQDGPEALVSAFPGLALHLVLWSAVLGIAYAATARNRV
ncbi:hypothetical protein ABZ801_09410 [Actinomadura sp. NPDC047616]|uniref:hypothetical protein n=1 Tax=Actinomadura sp. NPDC047616 TaxID=3155914 RepID=UPI0033F5A67F